MATIREICLETHLAVGTVSEILRGRPGYNEATRERVLKAAAKLNYRPNQLARGLRSRRSGFIGLVFASLAAPVATMAKLAVIERRARAEGYGVLIANHDCDPKQEREAIDRLLSNQVEGLILWSSGPQNEDLVRDLLKTTPVVTIESPFRTPTVDVSVDRERGAMLQVRHLLGDLKRKRLVFVLPRHVASDRGPGAAKHRGYKRGLAEFGQTFADHWLIELPFHIDDPYEVGQKAAQEILASDRPFDGIITSSDVVAMTILSALAVDGRRRIPEDVAVIGFGDAPFSAYLPIPLSTIRQPTEELGAIAFRLLQEQLASSPDKRVRPRRHVLAPALLVRDSTVADPIAARHFRKDNS